MTVRRQTSIPLDRKQTLESVKEDCTSLTGFPNTGSLHRTHAQSQRATKAPNNHRGIGKLDNQAAISGNDRLLLTEENLRHKLRLFLDASEVALKKIPASKKYPPPLKEPVQIPKVFENLSPKTSCAPFSSKCLVGCQREAEVQHKTSSSFSKRALSEGNMMQDFAWQRLFGITCTPAEGPTSNIQFGSFLAARRSTPASIIASSDASNVSKIDLQDVPKLSASRNACVSRKHRSGQIEKSQLVCIHAQDDKGWPISTTDASVDGGTGSAKTICSSELSAYKLQVAVALSTSQSVWL